MTIDIENEIGEFKKIFPELKIEHWNEGGVIFFRLTEFSFIKGVDECVLQLGQYLGYNSRLFFPKVLQTKVSRNWNHQNVLIGTRVYNAFSFQVPEGSLIETFFAHLGGAL